MITRIRFVDGSVNEYDLFTASGTAKELMKKLDDLEVLNGYRITWDPSKKEITTQITNRVLLRSESIISIEIIKDI